MQNIQSLNMILIVKKCNEVWSGFISKGMRYSGSLAVPPGHDSDLLEPKTHILAQGEVEISLWCSICVGHLWPFLQPCWCLFLPEQPSIIMVLSKKKLNPGVLKIVSGIIVYYSLGISWLYEHVLGFQEKFCSIHLANIYKFKTLIVHLVSFV